ncbi:MAG: hypothetical protein U0575_11805 [Phycisphaerales bacterium]
MAGALSCAIVAILAAANADACPPKVAESSASSSDGCAGPVPAGWLRIVASRHAADDQLMVMGFKDVPVPQLLKFIVESTGKTLITRLTSDVGVKVTILGDRPITRGAALDRVYEAMAEGGLAIVEDEEAVWIGSASEMAASPRLPLEVRADEDVCALPCKGVVVSLQVPIRKAAAPMVAQQAVQMLDARSTVVFDADASQLIFRGTAASACNLQRLVRSLDRVASADEAAAPDRFTQVPTGSKGPRQRWRDPLTSERVQTMSRAELAALLRDVASMRQQSGLSDDVRAQLKRDFDLLMARMQTSP